MHQLPPPVLLHTLAWQVGECPRHLSFRNDGAGIRTGTESMNDSSHLLTTCDGVRLAWAASGHGLPLVRAENWLTHLDPDAGSPVWRHWLRFPAGPYRYVRYDARGCGPSAWGVGALARDSRIGRLESVGEADGL